MLKQWQENSRVSHSLIFIVNLNSKIYAGRGQMAIWVPCHKFCHFYMGIAMLQSCIKGAELVLLLQGSLHHFAKLSVFSNISVLIVQTVSQNLFHKSWKLRKLTISVCKFMYCILVNIIVYCFISCHIFQSTKWLTWRFYLILSPQHSPCNLCWTERVTIPTLSSEFSWLRWNWTWDPWSCILVIITLIRGNHEISLGKNLI